MALVEKPDPRRKLILAAIIDFGFVALGVILFLASGNVIWVLGGLLVGTGIAAPMMIAAIREMKEQNNASG